jgi:L-asparagine transporter-like permease
MLAGLGIGGAAALLNIVVLTAVLSALNTKTYSNARMLHGMAEDGQAPKSWPAPTATEFPSLRSSSTPPSSVWSSS